MENLNVMKLGISTKSYLKKLDNYALMFDDDLEKLKSTCMATAHAAGTASENSSDGSFKIILNNIDLNISTRDMTSERQNRDIHWVNHSAVRNRVTSYDSSKRQTNISELDNCTILPSIYDHEKIRKDYIHLVNKVIVWHIPCLNFLQPVCPLHIPHKYTAEMSKKSEKVSGSIVLC